MKVLKFILALARVLLALLFAALACFSGKPAGIAVFALAAVLTLPINLFQKLWGLFGVKKNWIKVLIVAALIGTGLSQIPAVSPNEPAPVDVQPTATASVETPEPATPAPSAEPTATAAPTASVAPAVKATASPAVASTAAAEATDSPVAASTATPTENSASTAEPTAKPVIGATVSATSEPEAEEHDYILNTKSKKFHWPDCSGIKNMAEKNRKEFTGTREEVVDMGFSSCGICKP